LTNPTCFISYAWESGAHKDWVRALAIALCNNGVDVKLDQWDVRAGMDLTAYMEKSVRECDFVLLICTPTFAQKADGGKGLVAYEKMIATGQIVHGITNETKFKPILRSGELHEALPSYLKSRAFIDFRADDRFADSLEQLVRDIHDAPKYERPPIRPKPDLRPVHEAPIPVPPPRSVVSSEASLILTPMPAPLPVPSITIFLDPAIGAPISAELGQTWTRPADAAEMVFVPAGEFLMGSADSDTLARDDEKPQHTVYVEAFWVDKYEVTNAQYRKCVAAGACRPSAFASDDQFNGDQQPVVGVSWDDAAAYCRWVGGRLPTEAEWEKAARGTEGRTYPWGGEWDRSKANTAEGGPGKTTTVGSYPAGVSPYRCLDMAGNAFEWTRSVYKNYPYQAGDGREYPKQREACVLRGGAWDGIQHSARCAYRIGHFPVNRDTYLGFRVVVSPDSRR
jgi:formylglycine-generating enzyme required for sulfatase activity